MALRWTLRAHARFLFFSIQGIACYAIFRFPDSSRMAAKTTAMIRFVRSDETAVSQMKNWTVIRHVFGVDITSYDG
jgi:hypothetical protein